MKIQKAWESVDYYSSKASYLVHVFAGLLFILGTLVGKPVYVHYGLLILAVSLLQYLWQTLLLQRYVREQEKKGKNAFRFPAWLPWIGWAFFYTKLACAFLAIMALARC
jgi:hypothetical protein